MRNNQIVHVSDLADYFGAHVEPDQLVLAVWSPVDLSDTTRRRIDAHLKVCPSCRADFEAEREIMLNGDDEVPANPEKEFADEKFDVEPNELIAILLGQEKILSRLKEQPFAKFALGIVLLYLLERLRLQRIFVESGSTPKLATSAADARLADEQGLKHTVFLETNNSKIADWKPRHRKIRVRGIYGNNLNAEFGGFFPVSEKQIENAISDSHDVNSYAVVNKAWKEMLKRATKYDCLFMTATKFNFFAGPYVSSKENALLKCAFHTTGSRIALLLDGNKLLRNIDIVREWFDKTSVQVFDDGGELAERRFLERLFGLNHGSYAERIPGIPEEFPSEFGAIWDAKIAATARNPCAQLSRLPESVFRPKGAKKHMRVKPLHSWEDCVRQTLQRKDRKGRNGEVSVYIAEPDSFAGPQPFEQLLEDLVEDANTCFGSNSNGIRVTLMEPDTVAVNPKHRAILRSEGNGRPVRVWECRYHLADDHGRNGSGAAENAAPHELEVVS